MINFVNTGLDNRILKSMPTENISEDLEKAMNKAGLIQKEVQIKGKNGKIFIRKQWVRDGKSAPTKGKGKSQSSAKEDIGKQKKQKLNSEKMLDKLSKLPGWEEDGLRTKDGTFYAVSHDFDDINAGDIFVKTTVAKMEDGDIDDGQEMSVKEVYNEVMKNSKSSNDKNLVGKH